MASLSQYVVQFGRPGFLGRFRSPLALARGNRVVVRGPRGHELGEVLVAADPRIIQLDAPAAAAIDDGEILRESMPADEAELVKFERRGQELLARASARADDIGLPLAFVDVEVLLDGTAILHALHWAACDATRLLDELAAATGFIVRLLDLTRTPTPTPPPTPTSSCGKPGCGSESGGCSSCGSGGGCSTGSCSRGAVKTAEELTVYFADLRQKMETAGLVRKPLN